MKKTLAWLDWLFDESEDDEPGYDPVHLGAAVLVSLTAMGLLYWLLWTLLVFEGGFFPKVLPSLAVLFRIRSPQDYGYQGPWDRGIFEGIVGNAAAFVIAVALVWALQSLYRDAARKKR